VGKGCADHWCRQHASGVGAGWLCECKGSLPWGSKQSVAWVLPCACMYLYAVPLLELHVSVLVWSCAQGQAACFNSRTFRPMSRLPYYHYACALSLLVTFAVAVSHRFPFFHTFGMLSVRRARRSALGMAPCSKQLCVLCVTSSVRVPAMASAAAARVIRRVSCLGTPSTLPCHSIYSTSTGS